AEDAGEGDPPADPADHPADPPATQTKSRGARGGDQDEQCFPDRRDRCSAGHTARADDGRAGRRHGQILRHIDNRPEDQVRSDPAADARSDAEAYESGEGLIGWWAGLPGLPIDAWRSSEEIADRFGLGQLAR